MNARKIFVLIPRVGNTLMIAKASAHIEKAKTICYGLINLMKAFGAVIRKIRTFASLYAVPVIVF